MDRSRLIGRRFGDVTCSVEPAHVEEFAEVMNEDWDSRENSAIPLSYTPLLAMEAIERGIDLEQDLEVSQQRDTVMFGELGIEFYGPVEPGVVLTAELEITGVQTKQGQSGEFEIITIQESFADAEDTLRLEASVSAIVIEGE